MPTPEQIAQMAEVLGDTDWLEFLDQLDAVARRRRQRQAKPEPPNGHDRDEVAAWIARRHLLADSAIRQVWYLPEAAPPNEIRFLEVNDRLCDPGRNSASDRGDRFRLGHQGNPFSCSSRISPATSSIRFAAANCICLRDGKSMGTGSGDAGHDGTSETVPRAGKDGLLGF